MSNQEKYQKLKNIAIQIARDKEIMDQKSVEKSMKEPSYLPDFQKSSPKL